ncbi:MAG: DUF4255 domain-containing protein [Bacteroidota bacterium]
MISKAIRLIRDELSVYVETHLRLNEDFKAQDVILANISALEEEAQDFRKKIIVTLVNIEEESALKNTRNVRKTPTGLEYIKPPVHLNLYLLFSSLPEKDDKEDSYEYALHRLSLVIEFFQARQAFSLFNSPNSSLADDDTVTDAEKEELRLFMELYTLTFEQINHLWGSLGGKQVPSVMYKARLVKIQREITAPTPLIEEIQGDVAHKNR